MWTERKNREEKNLFDRKEEKIILINENAEVEYCKSVKQEKKSVWLKESLLMKRQK